MFNNQNFFLHNRNENVARPSALPERLLGTVSITAKFVSTIDPSITNPIKNISSHITICMGEIKNWDSICITQFLILVWLDHVCA